MHASDQVQSDHREDIPGFFTFTNYYELLRIYELLKSLLAIVG